MTPLDRLEHLTSDDARGRIKGILIHHGVNEISGAMLDELANA